MVKYIETGLRSSTHFLGIITDNTAGSWWVPFEFGMAKQAGITCAHLIDKEVVKLPSFIRISNILCNEALVVAWIRDLRGQRTFVKGAAFERFFLLLEDIVVNLPFLSESRPASDLKFVD